MKTGEQLDEHKHIQVQLIISIETNMLSLIPYYMNYVCSKGDGDWSMLTYFYCKTHFGILMRVKMDKDIKLTTKSRC